MRRGTQKALGNGRSANYSAGGLAERPGTWPKRRGVVVRDITYGGEEVAKSIRCDRRRAKVEVLAERSGLVKIDSEVERLGQR